MLELTPPPASSTTAIAAAAAAAADDADADAGLLSSSLSALSMGGAPPPPQVPPPLVLRRLGAARQSPLGELDVLEELEECALHPEGHSLLTVCRGRLFELSGLWGGPAPQLGARDGVRYACACYTHSGGIASAGCGKGGEWGLHLFPPGGGGGGPLRLAERGVELGEVVEMVASPTGAQVA